jgi:hypothetical protein
MPKRPLASVSPRKHEARVGQQQKVIRSTHHTLHVCITQCIKLWGLWKTANLSIHHTPNVALRIVRVDRRLLFCCQKAPTTSIRLRRRTIKRKRRIRLQSRIQERILRWKLRKLRDLLCICCCCFFGRGHGGGTSCSSNGHRTCCQLTSRGSGRRSFPGRQSRGNWRRGKLLGFSSGALVEVRSSSNSNSSSRRAWSRRGRRKRRQLIGSASRRHGRRGGRGSSSAAQQRRRGGSRHLRVGKARCATVARRRHRPRQLLPAAKKKSTTSEETHAKTT